MKYIIGNWKMKLNLKETYLWVDHFNKVASDPENQSAMEKTSVMLAPTFLYVPLLKESLNPQVKLGSQDVSPFEKGSHTGEVGAFQIREFCTFAIMGHSERKEPQELVLKKIEAAQKHGLIPVVCFIDIEDAKKYYREGIILAWEDPVNISAEGVYKEYDTSEISDRLQEIKNSLPKEAEVIYGGSVNRKNIQKLATIDSVCGILAGQASTEADHFMDLIRISADLS